MRVMGFLLLVRFCLVLAPAVNCSLDACQQNLLPLLLQSFFCPGDAYM